MKITGVYETSPIARRSFLKRRYKQLKIILKFGENTIQVRSILGGGFIVIVCANSYGLVSNVGLGSHEFVGDFPELFFDTLHPRHPTFAAKGRVQVVHDDDVIDVPLFNVRGQFLEIEPALTGKIINDEIVPILCELGNSDTMAGDVLLLEITTESALNGARFTDSPVADDQDFCCVEGVHGVFRSTE